jgi:hypothetical protein
MSNLFLTSNGSGQPSANANSSIGYGSAAALSINSSAGILFCNNTGISVGASISGTGILNCTGLIITGPLICTSLIAPNAMIFNGLLTCNTGLTIASGTLNMNNNAITGVTSLARTAWTAGEIIQTIGYSNSLGNALSATTGIAMTTIFSVTFTPKSANSAIYVTFDVQFLSISDYGIDKYAGQIYINTNANIIAKKRQYYYDVNTTNSTGGLTTIGRNGMNAFPLNGIYSNGSQATITIVVQFGADPISTGDDVFEISNPFMCYITEVQR